VFTRGVEGVARKPRKTGEAVMEAAAAAYGEVIHL
jgi:hypothetical protein